MFQISKAFKFSAAHQLHGLPEDHQCSRLHGHNYKVVITLRANELDSVGFVRDYGDFGAVQLLIDSVLEHRNINDMVTFNPTAENLARWFFNLLEESLPGLYSVEVCETDKTSAVYTSQYEKEGE